VKPRDSRQRRMSISSTRRRSRRERFGRTLYESRARTACTSRAVILPQQQQQSEAYMNDSAQRSDFCMPSALILTAGQRLTELTVETIGRSGRRSTDRPTEAPLAAVIKFRRLPASRALYVMTAPSVGRHRTANGVRLMA
jgi:hypothetical protein